MDPSRAATSKEAMASGWYTSGWRDGDAALTVSNSQIETVWKHVRDQKAHHTRTDLKTEVVGLPKTHDVE